jgi:hypothetical protein
LVDESESITDVLRVGIRKIASISAPDGEGLRWAALVTVTSLEVL